MSKLKKLGSMLLALVFAIGMTCTALAADTTQYTITVNNDTAGYTYVAYQIFVGDLSDGTLSNIEFGSALSADDQAAVLTKYDVTSAAALAELLADEDSALTAADFAEYIASFTLTAAGTSTYSSDNGNYTISVTGAGYYLVKNTVVPETDAAYSDYILKVVANTSVDPKADDVPTFDKTVSNSTTDGTAAYAVGDDVPFTLTATIPQGYSAYTTYKLVFTDTLSDGLTYNEDATVTIDGTTVTEGYTVDSTIDATTGETTVTITFANLKTTAAVAGSKVVVSYTAELNENAESVEENDAQLTFSNNPNDSTSTTTTPEDKTYVVTFDVTVNKVDGDKNALTGAAFTLYKYDETTNAYETTGTVLTVDSTGASFSIDGLAAGTYKLVETTTPAGYNTAADVVFTITATVNGDADTAPEITSSIDDNGNVTISSTAVTTTVVNEKGSNLPSTGGMGTTIFYIVGGVLVAGAVVLLVTKKRMAE